MTKQPPARKDYLHFHTMTTRWRDNDVFAHVNNAVFYEYVDTVVNHWMIAEAGLPVLGGELIGLVVQSECTYFAPLAFPGVIEGGLAVARLGRTSVTYDVALFAQGQEQCAARAFFTHVYVGAADRRPVPLPAEFVASLEALAR